MNHDKFPVSHIQGVTYLSLREDYGNNEISFMAGIPKINLGISNCLPTEHIAISGDDCQYPVDYFEKLLIEVDKDPKIGIISGLKKEKGIAIDNKEPTGSGRLYTNDLCQKIFPHPYINCGETMFLIQSELFGFKNVVCNTTSFDHLRPMSNRSIESSGLACYELGIPLYYTIARAILENRKSLIIGHVKGILSKSERASLEIRNYSRSRAKRRLIQSIPILNLLS
jgi:hypothetical protein